MRLPMCRSTTLALPSGSSTGVIMYTSPSRISRMKSLSPTAKRYASSMNISGEPVSVEWIAPTDQ